VLSELKALVAEMECFLIGIIAHRVFSEGRKTLWGRSLKSSSCGRQRETMPWWAALLGLLSVVCARGSHGGFVPPRVFSRGLGSTTEPGGAFRLAVSGAAAREDDGRWVEGEPVGELHSVLQRYAGGRLSVALVPKGRDGRQARVRGLITTRPFAAGDALAVCLCVCARCARVRTPASPCRCMSAFEGVLQCVCVRGRWTAPGLSSTARVWDARVSCFSYAVTPPPLFPPSHVPSLLPSL